MNNPESQVPDQDLPAELQTLTVDDIDDNDPELLAQLEALENGTLEAKVQPKPVAKNPAKQTDDAQLAQLERQLMPQAAPPPRKAQAPKQPAPARAPARASAPKKKAATPNPLDALANVLSNPTQRNQRTSQAAAQTPPLVIPDIPATKPFKPEKVQLLITKIKEEVEKYRKLQSQLVECNFPDFAQLAGAIIDLDEQAIARLEMNLSLQEDTLAAIHNRKFVIPLCFPQIPPNSFEVHIDSLSRVQSKLNAVFQIIPVVSSEGGGSASAPKRHQSEPYKIPATSGDKTVPVGWSVVLPCGERPGTVNDLNQAEVDINICTKSFFGKIQVLATARITLGSLAANAESSLPVQFRAGSAVYCGGRVTLRTRVPFFSLQKTSVASSAVIVQDVSTDTVFLCADSERLFAAVAQLYSSSRGRKHQLAAGQAPKPVAQLAKEKKQQEKALREQEMRKKEAEAAAAQKKKEEEAAAAERKKKEAEEKAKAAASTAPAAQEAAGEEEEEEEPIDADPVVKELLTKDAPCDKLDMHFPDIETKAFTTLQAEIMYAEQRAERFKGKPEETAWIARRDAFKFALEMLETQRDADLLTPEAYFKGIREQIAHDTNVEKDAAGDQPLLDHLKLRTHLANKELSQAQ